MTAGSPRTMAHVVPHLQLCQLVTGHTCHYNKYPPPTPTPTRTCVLTLSPSEAAAQR